MAHPPAAVPPIAAVPEVQVDAEQDERPQHDCQDPESISAGVFTFTKPPSVAATGTPANRKENRPAPTGGDNIVEGSKEDQCADL